MTDDLDIDVMEEMMGDMAASDKVTQPSSSSPSAKGTQDSTSTGIDSRKLSRATSLMTSQPNLCRRQRRQNQLTNCLSVRRATIGSRRSTNSRT